MAARPRLTVKFVYYHPNLCCSCKARYRLLVAGGLTPLDAAEAAPWRSYSLRSQATVRLARCLSLLCCMPLTLPIINHQVTDACGFRPALSAGWQGTRPCACDASKYVLNCDLTRPKAIAEAAALQGFDV